MVRVLFFGKCQHTHINIDSPRRIIETYLQTVMNINGIQIAHQTLFCKWYMYVLGLETLGLKSKLHFHEERNIKTISLLMDHFIERLNA